MSKLTFDMVALAAIIQHAQAATERRPCFADLLNKEYAKTGEKPDENGWFKGPQLDGTKIPAGLWLVKDDGIYLMSNGAPLQLAPNSRPDALRALVAYAKGYEPDAPDSWQKCRDAVGGDDFCEPLPLDWFTNAKPGATELHLNFTAKSISCTFTSRKAKK